ncbi:hypothetical protein [Gordonia alkanivorans]|uniref:hypothetical protein n=1 Tax=Gordonia alkanivorans TaxID=84096 RepID=UPI0004B28290|nr:hypothetical protein [Gordonia alkanivorans]
MDNAHWSETAADAQTAAKSSAGDRSRDRTATPGSAPPPIEPAKVVYRYEYNDPYAPMSTRNQVLLGCAISVVVIAFMVAALVIGRG